MPAAAETSRPSCRRPVVRARLHHRHVVHPFHHGLFHHHHHDRYLYLPPPRPPEGHGWVKLKVRPKRTTEVFVDGAAKGGVRSMSKSIAVELAEHDIRCNSVHPGFIWTNMQAQSTGASAPGGGAMPRDRVPLGRMGDPQDIANCVLYLASDESSYVTGAEFTVDAGMTAQ